MKSLDFINRLLRMDQLIRLKATGNPKAFARKLGVSPSTLYYYLDLLKSLGGPIRYSKQSESYEYEYPIFLEMGYRKTGKSENY